MSQPSVFISCVTSEFGQTRSRVADILTRLGFLPVKQEIFGTESGDLRQVLRDKIDGCEGLIQIIGQGYGAEPPTVDPEFGRVSYTQFEYLYARSRGKKTWLIFAGDACTRDNPLHALDLPWDTSNSDPLAYQAERRALQSEYRRLREQDGQLYHPAAGDADLLLKVEQLKNELEHLRRAETEWRKKVSRGLAALFILLAVIAAGVWWKSDAFLHWVYQDTKPTESRLREHLISQEEKKYQDALFAGEKISDLEERRAYLTDVEQQHQARVFRINSLVENFESLASDSHASVVMEELASIITVQGEEAGLKFIEPLEAGILERVKARPASAHQENRDDLLPLLIAALLQASHGDAKKSEQLFDQILEMEPDWTDARYFHFWYLIALNELAADQGDIEQSERVLIKARDTVNYSLKLDPKNGQSKHDLVVVLNYLGDLYKRKNDLDKAKEQYTAALEKARELADTIRVNLSGKREISFALNRLGDLAKLQRNYAQAETHFMESLRIADELAASDRSRESWQYDLMFTLRRLGDTSIDLYKMEQAGKYLDRAAKLAEEFAKNYPGDSFYQKELAISLQLLGDFHMMQNDLLAAESNYERMLFIDRDLLLANENDQRQKRELSVSLNRLGELKKRIQKYESANKLADESIEVMESLIAAYKDDIGLQFDLAIPLRLRRAVAEQTKDLLAEEKYARRVFDITRVLTEKNPEDDRISNEHVRSVFELSEVLLAANKPDEARELIEEILPAIEKFSNANLPAPAVAQWRRDHSAMLNRLATIAQNKKDIGQAKVLGESSLAIIWTVVASDLDNFSREQDLIYTLRLLSRIALDEDAFELATEHANEVLKLRQAQERKFPGPSSQYGVAYALFELAKIANENQDLKSENEFLKSSYEILRVLRENNYPLYSPLDEAYPKMKQLFGKNAEKAIPPE